MKNIHYTIDYQLEKQFKLRQKCYREGWMAKSVEDKDNDYINPYTEGSIEHGEWNSGYFDCSIGTSRE